MRLVDLLASQPDGASIADLLAPAVVAGELRMIAEASESELARCRRLDHHPVRSQPNMAIVEQDDLYYDPYDVELNTDPYAVFRRLRREAPLFYNEAHDFYAVSRYDDVERGLKDRETFISGRGAVLEIIKSGMELPPGRYDIVGMTSRSGIFPVAGMFFAPLHVPLEVKENGVFYIGREYDLATRTRLDAPVLPVHPALAALLPGGSLSRGAMTLTPSRVPTHSRCWESAHSVKAMLLISPCSVVTWATRPSRCTNATPADVPTTSSG